MHFSNVLFFKESENNNHFFQKKLIKKLFSIEVIFFPFNTDEKGVSRRYPTTQNVWQGGFMIPSIMEDILELVSVLSLPAGIGQLVDVTFRACLTGVLHHPKSLARLR